jgi:hypothetical protein
MEELTTVYLFETADGGTLGLSLKPSGSNLPPLASQWERRPAVPMTAAALAPFVVDPHLALTNLIMRGYHLSRVSAEVTPLPNRQRSVS